VKEGLKEQVCVFLLKLEMNVDCVMSKTTLNFNVRQKHEVRVVVL
jgi:hypothetical protein